MANSKGRANRLRVFAGGVLAAGVLIGFMIGTAFPGTITVNPTTAAKITSFISTSSTGEGAFNWLFAILVMGPATLAAAVLYAASELAGALRRSGRTHSGEDDTITSSRDVE